MTDCTDDYDATINLIVGEYQSLKRLNARSPLLRLITDIRGSSFKTTPTFDREYGGWGKTHKTGIGKFNAMGGAYYKDLREEVTKQLTNLLTKERNKSEEELWKMLEERGLVGEVRTHITHNEHPLKHFFP